MSDANGDYIVEAYSSIGLAMVLHVASIVSLCSPDVVEVKAPSICSVLRVSHVYVFNASLGSSEF